MKKIRWGIGYLSLAVGGFLAFALQVGAQPFNVNLGDVCVGFRKVGGFVENSEVVVNVGSISNYLNYAAGSSNAVPGFSPSQVAPDSFTNYLHLTWSAFSGLGYNTIGTYPIGTLWLTAPRSNPSVQTAAPDRLDQGSQQNVTGVIDSITFGASEISSRESAGTDNTATFVKQPLNLPNVIQGQNLGAYIASSVTATNGTFQDTWLDLNFVAKNVENSTSANFTNVVCSDLYEVIPSGFTDPHSLQTSGKAYFIGYFQLNTNGTMSFIRASASSSPPRPTLTASRSGNTTTITFTSFNGAIYTLYYSTDLAIPGWTSVAGTITGNGGTKFFQNTTTDAARFYKVSAQ